MQDSIFGLVGLQKELGEDIIAELHHANSHFVWSDFQLLNDSDDEIPDVSKPIRPNAVRAVNEEDYVLLVTRNICKEARREVVIRVPSLLCLRFAEGLLCYALVQRKTMQCVLPNVTHGALESVTV